MSDKPQIIFELKMEPIKEVKLKCSKCNASTVHQYTHLLPTHINPTADDVDALNEMQLMKKLTMCMSCANTRLLNP